MKWPLTLKNEALNDAYDYFDREIRKLPRDDNGRIDHNAFGLADNDVDAFRHAYVSAIMTIEYNEKIADILGRLNEFSPANQYSNSKDPRALNVEIVLQ